MRFHDSHGRNITLSHNQTVATRNQSFANALVFTERPLETNEVFLFEILEQLQGWAGNIRCGITFHNPTRIKIPQYLLPDLMKLGQSYIYAIKPCLADPFNDLNEECMMTETIESCKGISYCEHIDHRVFIKRTDVGPCDVGSRIGIMLSPQRELFFIINGVQYGPCTRSIPNNIDIFATADLYGNTRKIRILNFHVPRLKSICLGTIPRLMSVDDIRESCIPKVLKQQILNNIKTEEDPASTTPKHMIPLSSTPPSFIEFVSPDISFIEQSK